MRKVTEVEAIIDKARKLQGISVRELAELVVGPLSTWYLRMKNPLTFRHYETQRLFNLLKFDTETQERFNLAMRDLGISIK